MLYMVEIEIDLPRDRVVELFDSTENLFKWQRKLLRFEHLSGEPGQEGAKSALVFASPSKKNPEMRLVETILVRDLPQQFDASYETRGVFNVVRNRFVELEGGRTKWESENEFQFRGLMRLVGFFMRSAFPKQSLKYMQDFRNFAEHGTDVRDEETAA